jgi:hypothetical protein
MHIDDPSLWPLDLSAVRFSRRPGSRESYNLLTDADAHIGALDALHADDAAIGFEHVDGVVVRVAGGWALTIAPDHGPLEERLLFQAQRSPSSQRRTSAFEAWVRLSVLWALGAGPRPQG